MPIGKSSSNHKSNSNYRSNFGQSHSKGINTGMNDRNKNKIGDFKTHNHHVGHVISPEQTAAFWIT